MSFWGRLFGPPEPPATCPTCAILRDEHRRREASIIEAAERREAAFMLQTKELTTQLAAIADRTAAATASGLLARKANEEPREKGPFFRTPAMPQSMAGHTTMQAFRTAAKPRDKRKDLPPVATG